MISYFLKNKQTNKNDYLFPFQVIYKLCKNKNAANNLNIYNEITFGEIQTKIDDNDVHEIYFLS